MSKQFTAPAPLPTDRYVSRAERLAWQRASDDYVASIRAEEQAAREAQQPKAESTGPHNLTDAEYDALCRQRWENQQAQQKEREQAKAAKEQAEAAYMASRPDTVQISEYSPHLFLVKYAHWIKAGYELPDDGVHTLQMGCYSATLHKTKKK